MRNILTLSVVMVLLMATFSSCYKAHDCVCNIRTVTLDTRDTVARTFTHHTIKDSRDDAKEACKYYETEEDYLGRPAFVYHYCEIDDEYEK